MARVQGPEAATTDVHEPTVVTRSVRHYTGKLLVRVLHEDH